MFFGLAPSPGGEAEADPRARRSAGEPDAPAVGIDDGARNCEPEPGRAGLPSDPRGPLDEGFEDAPAQFWVDPVTAVGDLDLDAGSRGRLGPHHDAPVGRSVPDRVLE